MFSRVILAAVAALSLAAPADAAGAERMFQALPSAACGTGLLATGRPIDLAEPVDDATRRGVMAGLFLTLHDPTGAGRPTADMEATKACPVARFAADDAVWTVYSGAGGAPLRLISTPGREDSFILVRGPTLADAAEWSRARQGLPAASTAPTYYLVGLSTPIDLLIKLYDGPPSMAIVADDVADILEGRTHPLATYGAEGGAVNLVLQVRDGPRAELFRPGDLGHGKIAALFYPDSRLLTENSAGDFVFRGSGFACPPAFAAFERSRVLVWDSADESLDLTCFLQTEKSSASVLVTRRPDASADKAYWTEQIRFAQQDTGVAKRLSNPPTGAKATIQAGRNWIDKDGRVQVDFFLRRGEYLYEIRQTHTLEDLDAASKMLLAVFDQLDKP